MNIKVSSSEISAATGQLQRTIQRWADKENWPYTEKDGRYLYSYKDLPSEIQGQVLVYLHKTGRLEAFEQSSANQVETSESDHSHAWTKEDSEALWRWARTRNQNLQQEGMRKARLLMMVDDLVHTLQPNGKPMTERKALLSVSKSEGVGFSSLHRWWSRGARQQPIKNYPRSDWAALLIPGYVGGSKRAEIPPKAWDWFLAQYKDRRKPTLADTYRRTADTAKANGWGKLPSLATFDRRLNEEVSAAELVLSREGPEALARMFPPQRRDKTMLKAGEIVNGDGLKFDRLWVQFPDGEIINTATGWFWQDVYSGKILAWRLAKTENTDLFRLATYDLTAICVPPIAIIDNTRVAANKAMTGQAEKRNRFKNRPDDPIGLLPLIGIQPQFTNPDKVMGSPGAKPVERVFGKGGLHEMVATHPKFKDRGYSKKTAVGFDELQQVVAEEVARFNARPNRQTGVCRGVLSFDQAFEESFTQSEVGTLSEDQRSLLLLMPEVVRCNRRSGEIQLKAGSGPWGKHRYHTEALYKFRGKQVVVYYDPENLMNDVSVHRMDGQFITTAQHLADIPVIANTTDSREYHKNKARLVKNTKKANEARTRMDNLTMANYYPEPESVPIPEPGIVRPNFGLQHSAVDGVVAQRKVANGGMLDDDSTGCPGDAYIRELAQFRLPRRTEEDF